MDENHRLWEERGLRLAVLRGDPQAWQALYDQCFDSLYTFIDYRTGHEQDFTEEVAQESWMVAVRRIKHFDPGRSSFQAWLRGIAGNILKNHWRSHKRLKGLKGSEADLEAVADEKQPGSNPGSRLELVEQIGLALSNLPERFRSVLRAKYEENLSVAEIASAWDETPKAIESLLSRARSAFRETFAKWDREP